MKRSSIYKSTKKALQTVHTKSPSISTPTPMMESLKVVHKLEALIIVKEVCMNKVFKYIGFVTNTMVNGFPLA